MLRAGIAQLVEQLIRNQQVGGSSPLPGSSEIKGLGDIPDPFFLAKQLNVIKS